MHTLNMSVLSMQHCLNMDAHGALTHSNPIQDQACVYVSPLKKKDKHPCSAPSIRMHTLPAVPFNLLICFVLFMVAPKMHIKAKCLCQLLSTTSSLEFPHLYSPTHYRNHLSLCFYTSYLSFSCISMAKPTLNSTILSPSP